MPDEQRWAPFSVREAGRAHEWHVLHESVPPHLAPSLLAFVEEFFALDSAAADHVQRRLRLPFAPSRHLGLEIVEGAGQRPGFLLDVVDCLLDRLRTLEVGPGRISSNRYVGSTGALSRTVPVESALREANSAYRVNLEVGRWGLARRVDETATRAARELPPEAASSRSLAAAWSDTFRRDPDLDGAYRNAVIAVEAAACRVLIANDRKPTLGKAINHLRDTLDKWTVAGLDDQNQASAATLLAMLRTVWQNHRRHAEQGGRPPEAPDQAQAEAALFLAVALTQWFERGLVRPVGNE